MTRMSKIHGHWIPNDITYDEWMLSNHSDKVEGVTPMDGVCDDCNYFECGKLYKVLRVFKRSTELIKNRFIAVVQDEHGEETNIVLGGFCRHIEGYWRILFRDD